MYVDLPDVRKKRTEKGAEEEILLLPIVVPWWRLS
jgi:hypothetical protein